MEERIKKNITAITVFGGLFYLILLGMCVWQVCHAVDPTKRELSRNPLPKEIQITLQVTDSIQGVETEAKMDSLIRSIQKSNNYSEDEILNGLNDLRQETNNIIDKQNGWFSFWLAILALIGALLPFFIQLKLQQGERQRVDAQIEELAKLEKEQKNAKWYAEISKLSFTLINCHDNKWSRDNIDRDDFWNDMLSDLCKTTNKFVDSVLSCEDLHDENYFYLKIILVQLHAVYTEYIPVYSQKYKSRQLLELTHEIAGILGKMTNNSYSKVDDLRNDLGLMQMHMSAFSL